MRIQQLASIIALSLIFLLPSKFRLCLGENFAVSQKPKPSWLFRKLHYLFYPKLSSLQRPSEPSETMGQAVRLMNYDRAANERNAISALNFLNQALQWHRLDDGVMGGQSVTTHSCTTDGALHFEGTINTNGGGFCSIRAPMPNGLPVNTTALRLRLLGDGKTYKLTLSDGTRSTFGPTLRSPSWQADIPTKKDGAEEDITIQFSSLCPSWGPRQPSDEDRASARFQAEHMKEIGLMISLKLSDGRANPKETFGEGIFPFSLQVISIEPLIEMHQGSS